MFSKELLISNLRHNNLKKLVKSFKSSREEGQIQEAQQNNLLILESVVNKFINILVY
jgi:hypothetical protein